jgi:hypothetical protein
MSVLSIMIMGISACSENEDDISAPSLIIYRDNEYKNVLKENDTITLTFNPYNSDLHIYIAAKGNAFLNQMTIGLKNLDNPSQVFITETTMAPKHETDFEYSEEFRLNGIKEITRMLLFVTCDDCNGKYREMSRKFYVKPYND